MNINICFMYYDLLNVYGNRGNILILKKILNQCGISCNVDYITINDNFDDNKYDILFMGGGNDCRQDVACDDIIKNKRDNLHRYIEDGKTGLYTSGGYQLLGKRYVNNYGKNSDGAGIFDIYTEKSDVKFIGNMIIYSSPLSAKLVGFESHTGRTYAGKYKNLGRVVYGNGNNGEDCTEGLVYKNSICTYLSGCCLANNSEITRYLISSAIMKKYNVHFDAAIDDPLSVKAKEILINRYME